MEIDGLMPRESSVGCQPQQAAGGAQVCSGCVTSTPQQTIKASK